MQQSKKIALSLGVGLLFLGQLVYALPKPFSASYSVYKGSMNLGDMNSSLRYSGRQFQYYKDTQAKGFAALISKAKITENVDGTFDGDRLTPLKYYFNQTTRSNKRVESTRFSGGNAHGTYEDKTYDVKLPQGVLDRGSLELALAQDISNNKPDLSYDVMERGELKKYDFIRQGEEQITTPAGVLSTTKVSVVRSGNQRSTVFWLAEEMDYMPAKIIHTEKNSVITTEIKKYTKN